MKYDVATLALRGMLAGDVIDKNQLIDHLIIIKQLEPFSKTSAYPYLMNKLTLKEPGSLHTRSSVREYLWCKSKLGLQNFLTILPGIPYSWLAKNTPPLQEMKSWPELGTLSFEKGCSWSV